MSTQELVDRAEIIRTEHGKNANTAERVGGLLKDIATGLNVITQSNTAYVNRDLAVNNTDKRIFKSYEEAIAWILDNGSPSESCQWQIMLPGGFVPVVTVYAYIKPCGCEGTVVGKYMSAVNIPENPMSALGVAFGSNLLIIDLDLGAGRIGVLFNCVVFHVIDSACAVVSSGTDFLGGFLDEMLFVNSSYGQLTFTGTLNIERANMMRIEGKTLNLLNIVNFCTINVDMVVGRGGWATSSLIAGDVIMADGAMFRTVGCSGTFVVSGAGSWENLGSTIDARDFSGCLDQTTIDTQKLAAKVDALSEGLLLRSPSNGLFVVKINDLGVLESSPLKT